MRTEKVCRCRVGADPVIEFSQLGTSASSHTTKYALISRSYLESYLGSAVDRSPQISGGGTLIIDASGRGSRHSSLQPACERIIRAGRETSRTQLIPPNKSNMR